jgi:hypothetical protein
MQLPMAPTPSTEGTAMARSAALFAALLLVVLAPGARADTLYKCVDAAGLTTIQAGPCPKGQTQVWARPTEPEPPPTPEQLAAQQARREQAARESAERAAAEAIAAQRAEEADQMQEQVVAEEREKADAAAKRAGVVDAAPPPPRAEEGDDEAGRTARCDEAKAFAQSLRAKPWLSLDDAQWQRVYGWVFQQCR